MIKTKFIHERVKVFCFIRFRIKTNINSCLNSALICSGPYKQKLEIKIDAGQILSKKMKPFTDDEMIKENLTAVDLTAF